MIWPSALTQVTQHAQKASVWGLAGRGALSMLRHLFASSVFPGLLLLAGPALAQTSPDQAPIVCTIKDNVEDAACRKQLKGFFTRSGDRLTLKLEGGKSKTYAGNLAACDGENADASKCLVFRVLRYFPQTRSFLVERALYECGSYLFVSQHTGSETVMEAIPVLSPDAKYLLSIDLSDACDRKYDIAVWSMQTDPPKLEFKYQAEQYENWEVKAWENETHIKMKASIDGKTSYDQEAELVRSESGWALKLGSKADHPK